MAPTAQLGTLFTTEGDVQAYLGVDAEALRLTDQGESSPTATELNYLIINGINWATSRINMYCQFRYDAADLAQSWLVNDWATIFAARWLCSRRGNPVPQSLEAMYKEAIEDLKRVRAGQYDIPDIGTRSPAHPAWSNQIVRQQYWLKRLRVETPISDNTPTSYPQSIDFATQGVMEI